MASAIRRNPKKSAAAGIAALGLGTPALIGEDEEGKPIVEPGPEETGSDDGGGTKERGFLDMFRDANERLREFYSDPATQYGLAVAAQPSEGFVPRNALSDFIIGREQYKTLEADRDTALMSNFNFLKENTDLSDEEILSKLSGERTSLDQFLSIFGPGIASGTVGAEDIARFSSLFNLEESVSQPGITIDAEGKEVEQ
mgnify:CR=1 FL=1